jgi:hypothetical protein
MLAAHLLRERSGRLLVFAVAVIAFAGGFAALAIQSQDWQEILNQLYGLLD